MLFKLMLRIPEPIRGNIEAPSAVEFVDLVRSKIIAAASDLICIHVSLFDPPPVTITSLG